MLKVKFKDSSSAPVFVHSDIMPALISQKTDLRQFAIDQKYQYRTLNAALNDLRRFVGESALWFPAFNYDFCRDGTFDLMESVSQVGTFAEYFRVSHATWRTSTPIFSFSGDGLFPFAEFKVGLIDPFGPDSDFSHLVKENGFILFYGVSFSPTFIHHIERMFPGGPAYRYDKLFHGMIIDGDKKSSVTVNYHVMPNCLKINYDTEKIANDLQHSGLLQKFPDLSVPCYAVSAKSMLDFCLEKLNADPLYFLTKPSQLEVAAALDKLGRRFLISDFGDEHVRQETL